MSKVPNTATLARFGFVDANRAAGLLSDPVLADVLDERLDSTDSALKALGATADPEQAVLGLIRLLEAAAGSRDADTTALRATLRTDSTTRRRLLGVLGASSTLSDQLVRHPEHWRVFEEPPPSLPSDLREDLLRSVGADPAAQIPVARLTEVAARDALRVAYRRRLLALAGRDLAHPDPTEVVDRVSVELADLAAAALETALAVARAETAGHGLNCRLTVIGMGKCGGRELNYVSDVDVIYVAEPAEGEDEASAMATGAHLAQILAGVCSTTTAEGTLWPVDANLRPEGQDGPLVRTLASHLRYYKRWAKTWEFQALLKARPVAGDLALGEEYLTQIQPFIWEAVQRENFVPDVQAMRRRVEAHVPARESERQLKLGKGGLRDVEFSVQLLQLVHGRTEPRLRTGNTLEGLEQLSTYGFIGRDDAAALERAYRQLRVLEHRLQLGRLRRTHVLPTNANELRRLARGARLDGTTGLEQVWRDTRAIVRPLHERLFYRPILAAVARLSAADAQLSTASARDRLAALGYHDPTGALRTIEALIEGVSRRAAIQRQLLPVLLQWFAEGTDPDGGLLAFRRVSDALGTTHWYLKMLRDSGLAAERLARMLSRSRYLADLMISQPDATRWLDGTIEPTPLEDLQRQVQASMARHPDLHNAIGSVRKVRTREFLRIAIGEVSEHLDVDVVGRAISVATIAALEGGLAACEREVLAEHGLSEAPTKLAVISMGRLSGGELSYGSDADVMFVHDPVEGAEEQAAQDYAHAVCSLLQKVLKEPRSSLPIELDAALRPEGRDGPLVRSLQSYATYYERWSSGWEAQALLRADPIAGDEALRAAFTALIDPKRYPAEGLCSTEVREIRRIKARVESERLPRGVLPKDHLKLGPGGLADVEWTVQLLQLQHAARLTSLQVTSTLQALQAAADAGLIAQVDADELAAAWRRMSRLRNALMLWKGRASDVLPSAVNDLDGVARLLGYEPGSTVQVVDDTRRLMRHARTVVERDFYGQ